MKKIVFGILAGCCLGIFAAVAPAAATPYHVTFSGPGGDNGYLDFITSGNDITAITGITNGAAITGLSNYASADNKWFYPTAPYVDFSGIAWSVAGDAYGLGWTGSDYGLARQSINPNGYCCGDHPLDLAVTVVPAPPSGILLLSGLVLVAGVTQRKKIVAFARGPVGSRMTPA